MITRIISGGQTGADRAGLDFAIASNITHGGWIPKGRRAEDGVLTDRYRLIEMLTASYPKRTEQNVLASDGTVILTHGRLSGGGLLTKKKALQHSKPVLHLDLNRIARAAASARLTDFVKSNTIECLNVAGSRASKDPLIYNRTMAVLAGACLVRLKAPSS